MITQAYKGSFELWNNAKENILKMEHKEDITIYTNNEEEITYYNLYTLNKEMGYDLEIATDVKGKMITVDGKNKPVKDFIDIPEESNNIITVEEKKLYVNLVDSEQQNNDDALNEEDG
jgi:hypothetical protein